jgi:hypothetical protein
MNWQYLVLADTDPPTKFCFTRNFLTLDHPLLGVEVTAAAMEGPLTPPVGTKGAIVAVTREAWWVQFHEEWVDSTGLRHRANTRLWCHWGDFYVLDAGVHWDDPDSATHMIQLWRDGVGNLWP